MKTSILLVAGSVVAAGLACADEDAKVFSDYLKYSREIAAKNHLIVHARFEPVSGKGKPIESLLA